MELSVNGEKVFSFLKNKYIKEGYCFSGAISMNGIIEVLETFDFKVINSTLEELETFGIIQKSEAQPNAIELTIKIRKSLIEEYDLYQVWQADQSACFFDPKSKEGEITKVLKLEKNSK